MTKSVCCGLGRPELARSAGNVLLRAGWTIGSVLRALRGGSPGRAQAMHRVAGMGCGGDAHSGDRSNRHPSLLFSVLVFVAMGAHIVTPSSAQAATLIGNWSQSAAPELDLSDPMGQSIVTGENPVGYVMRSVRLRLGGSAPSEAGSIDVEVWTADDRGLPLTHVYDLVAPPDIATAGDKTFSAPAGARLTPNTRYAFLVSAENVTAPDRITLGHVSSTNLDNDSTPGWSFQSLLISVSSEWYVLDTAKSVRILIEGEPILPLVSLSASAKGSGSIRLAWTLPAGLNRSDVDAYRLEASDDDGLTWTELVDYTGDRTSLRYTMHRGLEPDTTYAYRITPIIGGEAGMTSPVVRATTQAAASAIDGLTWEGVASGPRGTGANLCWTPAGVTLSELSAFQYGRMDFALDAHSAMPFESDGTFEFGAIGGTTSCNGGAGTGMFIRALSGLEYFVKFRAMRDGRWVESNTVTVQVHDRRTTLKSQIRADGFYGIGPDAAPVFADVPATVTEPFQIAVGFGYHLPFDASLTQVTGFALSDLTATNATLSAPAGGFAFEQFIGYRVVVTPTAYGTDVTVRVNADAVTGTGTSKTSLASKTFTRKTAQARRSIRGPGLPALSVADAQANEGEDDTLAFTVTLAPASSGMVTVDYATADVTASAGSDYTATRGTLSFNPGETVKRIDVPVLDDSLEEGRETLALTLSNASGARIADGEATGVIVNSDRIPKAWIARFGRTLAGQAVNAVGQRLEGGNRSRVVVGGMTLGGAGRAYAHDPMEPAGFESTDRHRDAGALRTMTPRELLSGSTFRLSGGAASGGPAWTAWGRVATGGFDAREDALGLEGDVTSVFLGADVARGRWLGGLAVSASEGDGAFERLEDGRSRGRGRVESRLESLYPYARYRVSERTDVWGLVGYGTGELRLVEHAQGARVHDVVIETGLGMRMLALGARGAVLPADESQGLELALRSDAFWVRMESEAVESAQSGRLAASTGDASRIRLVLEGSRGFDLASGGTFTPSAQVGVRHDAGDAETGTGIEIGAGARFAGQGFVVEGAVRTLAAHEETGYEDWGVSGSVRIDPGASGLGLALSVAPAWGSTSSGVERLWSLSDAGRVVGDRELDAGRRLDAEVGYGFGLAGAPGVVTPYAGVSLADGGTRTYRSGARWRLGPGADVRLEAVRSVGPATDGGDAARNDSLMLRVSKRW